MPLSPPVGRQHLHTRRITCQGFYRDDGLWDIEGRITHLLLTDERVACTLPAKIAAGAKLRVRSDRQILLCRQAAQTLAPQVSGDWIEITLAATGEHPEPFRLLLA